MAEEKETYEFGRQCTNAARPADQPCIRYFFKGMIMAVVRYRDWFRSGVQARQALLPASRYAARRHPRKPCSQPPCGRATVMASCCFFCQLTIKVLTLTGSLRTISISSTTDGSQSRQPISLTSRQLGSFLDGSHFLSVIRQIASRYSWRTRLYGRGQSTTHDSSSRKARSDLRASGSSLCR
jgi:hypothetical protein